MSVVPIVDGATSNYFTSVAFIPTPTGSVYLATSGSSTACSYAAAYSQNGSGFLTTTSTSVRIVSAGMAGMTYSPAMTTRGEYACAFFPGGQNGVVTASGPQGSVNTLRTQPQYESMPVLVDHPCSMRWIPQRQSDYEFAPASSNVLTASPNTWNPGVMQVFVLGLPDATPLRFKFVTNYEFIPNTNAGITISLAPSYSSSLAMDLVRNSPAVRDAFLRIGLRLMNHTPNPQSWDFGSIGSLIPDDYRELLQQFVQLAGSTSKFWLPFAQQLMGHDFRGLSS